MWNGCDVLMFDGCGYEDACVGRVVLTCVGRSLLICIKELLDYLRFYSEPTGQGTHVRCFQYIELDVDDTAVQCR